MRGWRMLILKGYGAHRILTRDIDIAILSVYLSVCLSVRLSVTFRYSIETA